MEFVCPAWHYSIREFSDAVPILAAQSVRKIEVIICDTGFLDHTNVLEIEKLKRDLRLAGMCVNSVHAPFGRGIDISSLDDKVQEQGVASIIKVIEFTQAVDAALMVVHAGEGKVTADRSKRSDRAAGVIRELAVLAEEAEVVLAVENQPPGYTCGEAEETLKIVEAARSASVGVCFDTGHANLTGRFEEEARRLLPRTVTVHIHDNDGSEDQHLFPGRGTIDWALLADMFREHCLDAPLMAECRPPEGWDWPMVHAELGRMLAPKT